MLPEDIKIIMGNLIFIIFSVFALCFSKANADIAGVNKNYLGIASSINIEKLIQ